MIRAVGISLADTGCGLAPAVLARLFQPSVSTKGPEHGTGLGLSVCRTMMAAMGGTIEAANGPEGAVFVIALPAMAAPRATSSAPLSLARDADGREAWPAASATAPRWSSAAGVPARP